jgi:hypothetical protein
LQETWGSSEASGWGPVPVQILWIGSALGPMEQCSIRSFLQNGHRYQLFVYDTVAGIPPGAEVLDAEAILSRSSLFVDSHGSFSGFSNLFRYQLLVERGGIWADLDVVCLRPFAFNQEHVFPQELEEDRTLGFGSCVIKAPAKSEAMRTCLDVCLTRGTRDVQWGEFGPALLGQVTRRLELDRFFAPPPVFCPVPSWAWDFMLRDDPKSLAAVQEWIRPETLAVHFWNEMWRLAGVDKEQAWPRDCLYEELKRRFRVEGA